MLSRTTSWSIPEGREISAGTRPGHRVWSWTCGSRRVWDSRGRKTLPDSQRRKEYTLWGRLHAIKELVEESVVRIDHALDGKELRIGLAIPRPETDLSLAEIVRDVEAGLASRKKVTKKEKEIVVVENGREYRLRVNHHTNEQPTFVVDAIKERLGA